MFVNFQEEGNNLWCFPNSFTKRTVWCFLKKASLGTRAVPFGKRLISVLWMHWKDAEGGVSMVPCTFSAPRRVTMFAFLGHSAFDKVSHTHGRCYAQFVAAAAQIGGKIVMGVNGCSDTFIRVNKIAML